jgi:hypothetical protein
VTEYGNKEAAKEAQKRLKRGSKIKGRIKKVHRWLIMLGQG